MKKITAIIPTFNEERNIANALKSVEWCDEILVVDSFSTDGTLEIARTAGARVIQREYENSASQKNWAIPQASHEWILLLDADEEVLPELRSEVESVLSAEVEPSFPAYWIRRKNYFLGRRVRYSGWQGDRVVRLFRRECRYESKHVHAEISLSHSPDLPAALTAKGLGLLKGRLKHQTAHELKPYLAKWDRYSTWSAMDAQRKGVRPGLFHFFVKPWWRFTRQYIFQLGILDGLTGLVICSLDAAGVWMRYVKLWGLQRKR